MSILKKLCLLTTLLISILLMAPAKADAATLGQQLTSPEEGWQRYDDANNPNIIFSGTWTTESTAGNYNLTAHYTTSASSYKFKFYGTKIRLIMAWRDGHPTDIPVTIDGVTEYYSEYSPTLTRATLGYEKTGLTLGYHTVSVTNPQVGKIINIDAIDIDKDGYLVDYYQVQNLIATPEDSKVNLTWDAVDGATNYIIKRSTTSGGPYEPIGTSLINSFLDTGLSNGTTYFYVVSAVVSGIERENSKEVSATPTVATNPDYIGNYATLVITMTNGGIKEYTLPVTEIDKFITWYDKKSDGTGKSYYTFTKASSVSPYLRIREYISFNKISSFDLKEFNQ